jgi:hypothetical protein
LAWLAAGVFGAINFGGNAGNLAVGALLLLPIIRWPSWIKDYRIVAASVALPVFLISPQLAESPWLEHQKRHAEYAAITDALVQSKSGKILITPDSYLAVRSVRADIQDLGTWKHLLDGNLRSFAIPTLSDFLSNVDPDTIVCIETCVAYFSSDELRVLSNRYVQVGPKLLSKASDINSR